MDVLFQAHILLNLTSIALLRMMKLSLYISTDNEEGGPFSQERDEDNSFHSSRSFLVNLWWIWNFITKVIISLFNPLISLDLNVELFIFSVRGDVDYNYSSWPAA